MVIEILKHVYTFIQFSIHINILIYNIYINIPTICEIVKLIKS